MTLATTLGEKKQCREKVLVLGYVAEKRWWLQHRVAGQSVLACRLHRVLLCFKVTLSDPHPPPRLSLLKVPQPSQTTNILEQVFSVGLQDIVRIQITAPTVGSIKLFSNS